MLLHLVALFRFHCKNHLPFWMCSNSDSSHPQVLQDLGLSTGAETKVDFSDKAEAKSRDAAAASSTLEEVCSPSFV